MSSVLRRHADAQPDRPFLRYTEVDHDYTYGEFNLLVNRVANGLAELGVRHGSYVNLMLPNGIEYMAVSYALRRLGAVEVAINSEVRGPALARMLSIARASVLVVAEEYASHIALIAEHITVPPAVIVVVGDVAAFRDLNGGKATLLQYEELEQTGREADPGMQVKQLDAAAVLFTSGTTGPAKGCILSHRYLVRAAEIIVQATELTAADRMYTAYPLFHGRASMLDIFASVLVGGSVVIAPRFSASRFWEHIRRFDVTIFSIIGTVMQIIWKQPPSSADRDHRLRITWGGPITVEPARFEDRFGVRVLPGEGVYGMTETGVVSMSSFDPERSGRVRPECRVCIADDDDAPVPVGETGEILVRPEEAGVIYSGYLAMPEETVKAWRNLWFHTGDLGRIEGDGRLIFVGRKGERIRRAGHNISAWEVEEVLDAHPSVLECAVIGVPTTLGEQEVKAFVVPRPGCKSTVEELMAHCRANLARFMVPQQIELLAEMPKTQNGKPAKGALLALHLAQAPSTTP